MTNEFTEAPASNTFKVKSPKGFEHMLTMRDETVKSLIEKIEKMEEVLLSKGWTPLAQNPVKTQKPVEYVEGKACPKCQNKLIYATTKAGQKFIKCSTNKWINGQSVGCDYVDWLNKI